MTKTNLLLIANFLKSGSIALLLFPVSALAEVYLRDWVSNPFNECLVASVEKLVQADENTKVTFLEYSVKNRPQPFAIVDATLLLRKVNQGQAQVLNLELAAAPTFHWSPFPENNWYLGYRTQQVDPVVVVRQLSSPSVDVVLDISTCLITNEDF